MTANERPDMIRWLTWISPIILLIAGTALGVGNDKDGRIYYIDGAGNWGYGVSEVKDGLAQAGYKGKFINFTWSPTLNPALDQTIGRPIARARGADLGKEITKYLTKYPDNQVSIICLSAGTGVGVWACEKVKPPAKVHSLVMLGSSLSSNYDMNEALSHIQGHVYVYYSTSDMVCQGPVRTLGTIDGKLGTEPAGLVGLHPRGMNSTKIVNIPWSSKYNRYGWTGAHTDATSVPFVRAILSKHILPEPPAPPVAQPIASASPPPPPPAAQPITAASPPPPQSDVNPSIAATSQPH